MANLAQSSHRRVLFMITKSNFGGAQRYVFDLATRLKAYGYTPTVACGGNGPLVTALTEAGVPTHTIPELTRDPSFFRDIATLRALYRLLRQETPDIVHLNSSKAALLGAIAARLVGIPRIVYTVHGWPFLERRAWWWKGVTKILSAITVLLAHQIILVSQHDTQITPFARLRARTVTPLAPRTSTALSPEVARARIHTHDTIHIHAHDTWVVTVAELTHNKNLATAIRAVAEHNATQTQKIFYTIIGEGEDHALLEQLIHTTHTSTHIRLVGYYPNPPELFSAFDIFFLPSSKEGFPYALLEAGAYGLPCIASAVGGIPEIITHNTTGLLVNPADTASMTQALATAVSVPDTMRTYATRLKQHVTTSSTYQHMLEVTTTVYESDSSIKPKA